MKDKKLPWIAAGAAIIVILLVLKFMPGSSPDENGPEVISKRVKIELQDTATDISASIEPTTDGMPLQGAPVTQTVEAPQQIAPAAPLTVQPQVSAPKPVAAVQPKIEPKAVVEPKPAVPAPSVKVEAPKAVKTVKPAKKAVEKAKKTTVASKKIAPAKALALNIASFTSLSEAQGLAGKLKKGGYNAYISSFTKDSIRWHRVRVGFFASRDEAARTGKTSQSKYHVEKPWIAKPDATELKTHL